MVRVVVRDMGENTFLDTEFSEGDTVGDVKRYLVASVRKSMLLDEDDAVASESLCFRVFCNKEVVSDDTRIATFGLGVLDLYFEIQELLDAQKTRARDFGPVRRFERRVAVCVSEKYLIEKNGKLYFVISRSKRPRLFRDVARFVSKLQGDLLIKALVISVLVFMRNLEVAFILTAVLTLKLLGARKLTIRRGKMVCKTAALFMYTMFVISADDNIVVA